ncbi:hypothetical protein CRE_16915 [Caenorhabditis remanei]|uniref:Uncharacterized protein n=1 Tax=Caenorhabditis remanei TaxID=31234 RepID=E3MSD5_CAERE|nr:hypothetical protein CRE_16915 [Caenorhabditis remanei]
MLVFIIFTVFSVIAASSRFGEPEIGTVEKLDPREYEILSVGKQSVAGDLFTFETVYGESTCEKDVQLSDLFFVECSLKQDGQRSIWKVTDHERVWMKGAERNVVTVSKVRDLEAGEEI